MAEVQHRGERVAVPTVADLLVDPAVSYALKEVLLVWEVRDPVDAARRADEAVSWAP